MQIPLRYSSRNLTGNNLFFTRSTFANHGDSNLLLTNYSADTYRFVIPLTATRNIRFPLRNLRGKEFTIVRVAGGAFDLTIATSLAVLAQNQWGVFQYDGNNWFVKMRGSLTA